MNITTKQVICKTIEIHLKREDLKRNLYCSFLDLFKDEVAQDEEDVEYFETDVCRLTDCMQQINKGNFEGVFADGYTMMILDGETFRFVENWFNKPGSAEEDLCLVITDKDGKVEVVDSNYLSF